MRIGIDLGGTKIEAVALDAAGAELRRQRVDTPSANYRGILQAIAGLVGRLEEQLGRRGTVGVGMPGSVSRVTGGMKNSNTTVLNGRPFARDLSELLSREVRVANDADCFTLSEASDGAGKGADTVFGVILGTGVGGGLVFRRQLLSGPNGISGEWGHNPLVDGPGERGVRRRCYCGRQDCIETWLSGPGLALSYSALGGEPCSAREIGSALRSGEALARSCYQAYAKLLARALATVINIVDPHVIVLGGGLSNIDELYRDVPENWGEHVFSDRVDTRLLKARHGDASGVRGAAWLWQ